MKLLLDQDVYEVTVRFLTEIGHDVVKVSDLGLAAADDEENLLKASELGRIFVTRDRDYGNLVYVRQIRVGVLYLRILPSSRIEVHKELDRVLKAYTEDELRSAFIVVEPGRHRFRRI
jgi:predicted nuclease of predicted toxin-antitoxin system